MLRVTVKRIVLAVSCFLYSFVAGAADREKIPVHLSVECDDAVLRSELTSLIGRELRNIGDVELFVDEPSAGGLVSFDVVAVTTCSDLGVAVSYGVHERFYLSPSEPYIEEYLGHGVYTDRRADMRGLAQRLVATFDSSGLNEWRRQREAFGRNARRPRAGARKQQ